MLADPLNYTKKPFGVMYYAGVTLIECLVATAIFATTIIGALGLQIYVVNANQQVFNRSAASMILMDISSRMLLNETGVRNSAYEGTDSRDYNNASSISCFTSQGGCTSAEIAEEDKRILAQYFSGDSALIPSGYATIETKDVTTPVTGTQVEISVNWPKSTWGLPLGGSGNTNSSSTSTFYLML